MASEYDLMLPEDRAQKIGEFEKARQTWVQVRNRGMARFILLHGALRQSLLVIAWNVLNVLLGRGTPATALRITIVILLTLPLFNLGEWYWNERRYRKRVL